MQTMNEPQQLGSSIMSIETNVIAAGLKGIAVGWILLREREMTKDLIPKIIDYVPCFDSDWANVSLFAVYAVLAVIVAGFIIEGIAGVLETLARWRLWGKGGEYWNWYSGGSDNLKAQEKAQRWIWKSEIAHKDFSRRRLRILVTRNTACCFLILTIGSVSFVKPWVLALFAAIASLFVYLWHDARKGLRSDFIYASKVEP